MFSGRCDGARSHRHTVVMFVIPNTKQIESRMLDLPEPLLSNSELVVSVAYKMGRQRSSSSQSGDRVERRVPSSDARPDGVRLESIQDEFSYPHLVSTLAVLLDDAPSQINIAYRV